MVRAGPSKVGVLLLAAGSSKRFGSDKRLSKLASGNSLLEYSLQAYLDVTPDCAVVIDSGDRQLESNRQLESILCAKNVHVIRAADAQYGMGHSLAAGIKQLQALKWAACLVVFIPIWPIRSSACMPLIIV